MSNAGKENATRPKILLLVKGLGLGGVERLLSQSVPHLSRASYDYEVCYFTPWKNDVVGAFQEAGIPVHCLDVRSDWTPKAARRLTGLLTRNQYDLIHTHSPFPSALARILAPRSTRALIHTEHSLPGSRRWVTRAANRLTYRRCDLVISVSRVVDEAVHSGWPRPRRSQVIYGGTDDKIFSGVDHHSISGVRSRLEIPDSHLVVGNVAHLRPQKGLITWLDTARQVLETNPETTFVLVGREKEPGYQSLLESHAKQLGITKNVRFVGFQPEPYEFLALFNVFLMTSEFEGFPIALVEAMAMGIPCISTDVGGVREALGEDADLLVTPRGDVNRLVDRARKLLEDPAARAEWSKRLAARARLTFTIEKMVCELEASYAEVLG